MYFPIAFPCIAPPSTPVIKCMPPYTLLMLDSLAASKKELNALGSYPNSDFLYKVVDTGFETCNFVFKIFYFKR